MSISRFLSKSALSVIIFFLIFGSIVFYFYSLSKVQETERELICLTVGFDDRDEYHTRLDIYKSIQELSVLFQDSNYTASLRNRIVECRNNIINHYPHFFDTNKRVSWIYYTKTKRVHFEGPISELGYSILLDHTSEDFSILRNVYERISFDGYPRSLDIVFQNIKTLQDLFYSQKISPRELVYMRNEILFRYPLFFTSSEKKPSNWVLHKDRNTCTIEGPFDREGNPIGLFIQNASFH